MRYPVLVIAAAAMSLAPAARADLTVHYKTSYQFAPGLPAPMADALKQQMGASMPGETTIRIHGDQVVYQLGPIVAILDYARQQLTLLHTPSKRFATSPTADFAKQIGALFTPAMRDAMQGIQMDVKGAKSGRTAVIQGVPVEETVITMTMQNPGAAGPPMQMRIELHNWMATSEALERFPVLRQWKASEWASSPGFGPSEMMSVIFSQSPSAEKFRDAMQALMKQTSGVTLKTESGVFAPGLAQMMAAQGVQPGDGPLVSTIMEMDRFDASAIPDAAFQVPAGYSAAPFSELVHTLNPVNPVAPKVK